MTQVAKLSADLVANTSSFETGLKRADRTLQNSAGIWSKSLKTTTAGFSTLGDGVTKLSGTFSLLSGAVTAAIGSGFLLMAKGAIDAASAIDDTSQRLQISTTDLQKFQYTAKLAGIENETLEGAFTKLNAKIADGSLKYKNTTEAVYNIAEAVRTAKTDTERAAIANDAFGAKMGAKLIPFLTSGAAGLRDFGNEAERTGNVMSEQTIKKAAALGDQLDILGGTIKKNFQEGLLDSFVDKSGELKSVYDDPEFGKNIRNIGEAIGLITTKAVEGAGSIANLILQYQQLNDKVKNFKFGLSQETFDALNGNTLSSQRSGLQPYRIGKDQYGPNKPSADPAAKPYVYSADNAKADRAAQQFMKDAEQREKTTQSLLNGLREESDLLKIQTDMYGQKESAIKRAQKELQINNQLSQAGITLTQEQKKQQDRYLDSLEKMGDLQAKQEKQTERLKEKEKNRQQAMDQLGSTFESAFEDAIVEGEKLGDVFDSLLKDIAKILLRQTIIKPIIDGITDSGFFSDIGKSFSSFLPSFAVGTDYVSRDMTANIHKGEMIIPARQAEAIRNGGGGSGGVVVNITNNSSAKVSSSAAQGASGTELNVMIDQAVAENIARRGSRTNQALGAFSGQTLVKR